MGDDDDRDSLPPAEAKVGVQTTCQSGTCRVPFPLPTGPKDLAGWALVIEFYKAGDRAAFTLLVDGQIPVLRRYASRVLRGARDADDVVSDGLIAIWKKHDRFDGDLKGFRNLSRRIVELLALELRQGDGGRKEAKLPQDDLLATPDGKDPLAVIECEGDLDFLKKALRALPKHLRNVVRLRMEGLDGKAIAAECSRIERTPVNPRMVCERYQSAVEQLRVMFAAREAGA